LETVATRFQTAPQLPEIVDFTVEDDRDASGFIENWLVTAAEVNDAEPAHPERYRAIDKQALVVGAAMVHLAQHLPQDAVRRLRICTADYSADSTHRLLCRSV
jgi:hypothetical protein